MLAKDFLQSQLINSSKFHMKKKISKSFKVFDHDVQITVKFKQQIKVRYRTFSELCWSLNFVHLDLLKYSFK